MCRQSVYACSTIHLVREQRRIRTDWKKEPQATRSKFWTYTDAIINIYLNKYAHLAPEVKEQKIQTYVWLLHDPVQRANQSCSWITQCLNDDLKTYPGDPRTRTKIVKGEKMAPWQVTIEEKLDASDVTVGAADGEEDEEEEEPVV